MGFVLLLYWATICLDKEANREEGMVNLSIYSLIRYIHIHMSFVSAPSIFLALIHECHCFFFSTKNRDLYVYLSFSGFDHLYFSCACRHLDLPVKEDMFLPPFWECFSVIFLNLYHIGDMLEYLAFVKIRSSYLALVLLLNSVWVCFLSSAVFRLHLWLNCICFLFTSFLHLYTFPITVSGRHNCNRFFQTHFIDMWFPVTVFWSCWMNDIKHIVISIWKFVAWHVY